ncbi:hypothetical protein PIB30_046482 [Stylosanthes scabra]|uniref:Zinc finger GRF-type domain-containing protein n=1 Tax=Stylosanthes scabra TaxID=79078 RepID=A0ABU6UF38_9FABA|nr:hypothetical protein [Stylosanthes scabra]
MDSDGVASSQRRSTGAGRSDRSSSTQGVHVPTPGDERPGEVAPKCHCGVYAIPYLSRTKSNPNRLFFGCPFFKARLTHYKFFMWLDVYTTRVGRGAFGKFGDEGEDVREHFRRFELEEVVQDLGKRVAVLEKKKNMNIFVVVAMFVAIGCVFFVKVA